MLDTEEQIRQKAYEIWVSEGKPNGRADEHWAKASALVSDVVPSARKAPARKRKTSSESAGAPAAATRRSPKAKA